MKHFIFLLLLAFATNAIAQSTGHVSDIAGSTRKVYKTVDSTQLSLHLFYPQDLKKQGSMAAIVFFFGGAWVNGNVKQFEQQCRYFASRGMVAIAVDYRVRSRNSTTPFESVMDAKSAMRYLRLHAKELSIDANKIVAAGGSAGGHLAAATAFITKVNESGEDTSITTVPNALVLYNPAVDLSGSQANSTSRTSSGRQAGWRSKSQEISPLHHIGTTAPPTIIFHGTADTTVAFAQATRFCEAMKAKKHHCEVVAYEGRYHGFFNFGRPDYEDCLKKTENFLRALGFLEN